MNDKFLSMLGIARKAGAAVLGFEKTRDTLKSGNVCVVCVCSDISEKTLKELLFFAQKTQTPIIQYNADMFAFSNAVGTKTGIIAVTDRGIANKLMMLGSDTVQQESKKG